MGEANKEVGVHVNMNVREPVREGLGLNQVFLTLNTTTSPSITSPLTLLSVRLLLRMAALLSFGFRVFRA